ncbi:hypothetical protein GCM10027359_14930 [Marilutibacter aestuarii]
MAQARAQPVGLAGIGLGVGAAARQGFGEGEDGAHGPSILLHHPARPGRRRAIKGARPAARDRHDGAPDPR